MKIFVFLLFVVWHVPLSGQLHCINYNSKDGLLHENVTTVSESTDGYIYLGTSAGIIAYNGITFIEIGKLGNGDLPGEVFIEKIVFDTHDNLWASTERNGLFHLDRKTNRWTNYTLDKSIDAPQVTSEIFDIELHDNQLLVACEPKGLLSIDTENKQIKNILWGDNQSIKDVNHTDDSSILATTLHSIFRLTDIDQELIVDTLLHREYSAEYVHTYITKTKKLLAASYQDGIKKIENGVPKSINTTQLADTWRYTILGENNGKLWVVLYNHGLAAIDMVTGKWTVHKAEPYNFNSLPLAKYNGGYIDSKGIIWVASTKGLTCIHPSLQAFEKHTRESVANEFLIDAKYHKATGRYVLSYASDKDKIKIYDKDFKLLSGHNHTPSITDIRSIFQLLPYKDKFIGLGTHLMQVDPATEKVARLYLDEISNLTYLRAAVIDEDILWLAYERDKLIKYDLNTQKIISSINIPLIADPGDIQYSIREIADLGDFIGVAARSVFFLISKSDNSIFTYDIDTASKKVNKINGHPTQSGTIHQVALNGDHLYISTRNEGLLKCKINTQTHEVDVVKLYEDTDIYSPVEMDWDTEGHTWTATDNGLVLLDQDFNIKNKIQAAQGLTTTKLSTGLAITNGYIFLNDENGFSVVDPTILLQSPTPQNVFIDQLSINGKNYNLEEENSSVPYTQKNVLVNVSLPIYGIRDRYKYSHRLVPHQQEWISTSANNTEFRYDNLPPAEYTFQVKSFTDNKASEVTEIAFTIKPPYWKTWWFLLATTLVGLLLLTIIYKARVKQKLKSERLNTRIAQLQNEAIRAQLNPHFIFNALNSIRSLILMDKKDNSLDYLSNFSTLVREILAISKETSIPLEREIQFNKKYVAIERLRFSQELDFKVIVSDGVNTKETLVPPMIMQPIIENAIWHGLLGKDGDAELTININRPEKDLVITVDDNGIGRKAAKENKSHIKTRKGYGEILSKERLATLGENATFQVIDKEENGSPTGTKIIITLPSNS